MLSPPFEPPAESPDPVPEPPLELDEGGAPAPLELDEDDAPPLDGPPLPLVLGE